MKFKNNRLKKASLNHTALTTNMNPFSNTMRTRTSEWNGNRFAFCENRNQ